MASIKVTLRRSIIGRKPMHRRTLAAMGLRRIGQSAVLPDNECTRGMIKTVEFMVDTEMVDGQENSS
ncbi:MAG: 50S ribosomal protein L30 [Armatimonadetes bacterium]|nr:50S ribosomal protein L30 [Armatimonadota bacterium]